MVLDRSLQLKNRLYKLLESGCWIVGSCLLAASASHFIMGEFQRQRDLESFDRLRAEIKFFAQMNDPDLSLWSESRKIAYLSQSQSLMQSQVAPNNILGILSIPDVGLRVPIYDGDDDLNLERGVVRIAGTGLPNQGGNSGIAGHRDSYFRVLKDVEVGQFINVQDAQGEQRYRVSEILIVEPHEIEVLQDTQGSTLTLVTCYPFYFVGPAPKRYIVKATISL